jgi:hypothetical protein
METEHNINRQLDLNTLPMYGYSMNEPVLLNYTIEHNRRYNDMGKIVEYLESGEFLSISLDLQ